MTLRFYILSVMVAVAMAVIPITVWSQVNFRISRTYLDANENKYIDQIDYFDGLGRSIQNNTRGASPNHGNVINLQEYDANGRKSISWCPIPTSNQDFVSVDEFIELSSQYHGDDYGFTSIEYEQSPDEFVSSETRPGAVLHTNNKSKKRERIINNNSQLYRCRNYSILSDGSLKLAGNYPPGSLLGTKSIDEDGHTMLTFNNADDKVVLSRAVLSDGVYADTYYIYDDYGQLRYVLPPLASDQLTSTNTIWSVASATIDKYGYYYEYDIMNNITVKKLPGQKVSRYFYDCHHRLALMQDGNRLNSSNYTLFVYDKYGREIIVGAASLIEAEKNEILQDGISAQYTGQNDEYWGYSLSIPIPTTFDVERVYYYDNYNFIYQNFIENNSKYAYIETDYNDSYHNSAVGRLTGNIISGNPSVFYYNKHGNIVQSHCRNHFGGVNDEYITYSYSQKPLTHRKIHQSSRDTVTETYRYTYDHADRLLTETHQLDDGEIVTLVSNQYDNLCRLSQQTIGDIVDVSYSYDIEGRTRQITSDPFSQTIMFDDGIIPSYNGNISTISWNVNDGVTRSYSFEYDNLDRLLSAEYETNNSGDYSTTYQYDKHGNPTKILRQGIVNKNNGNLSYDRVDNLSLEYSGNQLSAIYENAENTIYAGATDYHEREYNGDGFAWDDNGNMTRDAARGISSITYNRQNLPTAIVYDDGHKVIYTYDAIGQKQRVYYQVAVTAVTAPMAQGISSWVRYRTELRRDFCDNIIFRNDSLERILTTTGYISADGTYHHFICDYQGNNRIVINDNGVVEERINYYPYGMPFPETANIQPYKYSQKELDMANGLNQYDFGARWYSHATALFTTQDPLAEKYYALSPYIYCAGNPIMLTDPTGMDMCVLLQPDGANGLGHMAILIQNEDGKWSLWSKNGTDENSGIKGDSVDDEGKDKDEKAAGVYESVEDFFDSGENKNGMGTDNAEKSESKKYTTGFMITSTPEEDKAARDAAGREIDKSYSLIGANCATMVQDALTAAGKDSGTKVNNRLQIHDNIFRTVFPNIIFTKIINNNPGKLIRAH